MSRLITMQSTLFENNIMKTKIIGIGINNYADPKLNTLHNCTNDLNAVFSTLYRKYGLSDVELLTEKEQTTNRFIYQRLYDLFTNSTERDNIILVFAGHGEYNSILGSSYWLPSDARQDDVTTWFDIHNLLKFIKSSLALHICIIADSCFSGAIFGPTQRGGGILALESKKSRLALASGVSSM